jgi:hypothetical protein
MHSGRRPSWRGVKETIRTSGGAFYLSLVVAGSELTGAQSTNSIESTFPQWLESLYEAIDHLFPAPDAFMKLSLEDVPPARIRLENVEAKPEAPSRDSSLWAPDVRWAKIREMERVTKEGWYQDVRSVELEVEGVEGAEPL